MSYVRFHLPIGVLLAGLLFSAGVDAMAQSKSVANTGDEFRRRVHSIESFMDRFNYEEDAEGNQLAPAKPDLSNEGYIQQRNEHIKSLFDRQNFSDQKRKNKELLDDFLKSVNSSSQQVKLNFYDRRWFAEVQVDVLYKKKPASVTLILQNEETQPKMSKWVIRSVLADFLMADLIKGDDKIIPPNSHGTDFIGIPGYLSQAGSVNQFAAQDLKLDPTSIFFYAVANQEIEFQHTRHVTFHLLQVNNWILRVEEFNRNESNSGWLVAELMKADDDKKRQYAAQHLRIP